MSKGQAPNEGFKDCEGQRQAMAGGAGVGWRSEANAGVLVEDLTLGTDAQSYPRVQARVLWDCMTQDIFFMAVLKGTDEECGVGEG